MEDGDKVNTKKMLRILCEETGVSGREEEMYDIIKELTEGFSKDIKQLPTGTIVVTAGNKDAERHIMLDAHIDRIGLIVTYIGENGFVNAEPVGGMDMRALPGTVVTIQGKENVTGVIATLPPHLVDKEKGMTRDDIRIDTGLSDSKLRKLVSQGDTAVVKSFFRELLNDKVAVSALDNRAGCAVIIKAAELVSGKLDNIKLSLVFSSQEETNESGASTAAFLLEPDEAIVVDTGFAKQEGVPSGQSGEMGKGPIISIAPVLSRRLTDRLMNTADKLGITYALEVDGGMTGTNADGISVTRGGIPCAVISVPDKNMHTQTETVSIKDIEDTARVIAEYIIGGAEK